MPKSTTKGRPRKPHRDLPFYRHATGRWAKRVRGKIHYFGSVAKDPQGEAALAEWLRVKDDLLAGRVPRPKSGGLTVWHLVNAFLSPKKQRLDAGELRPQTYQEYHATCERLGEVFGMARPVADLTPADFENYRARIAERWGPAGLKSEVQRVRSVFKYAFEAGLLDSPVRFGPEFKGPSRKTLRLARAAKPPKMFTPAEILSLLDAADQPLRAMMLLGLNCGFGNTDCGRLPKSALDLDAGWVSYPRPKTGIPRRCPLWPETVAAVREALTQRPVPKDEADVDLAFITKYGQPWAKDTSDNPVSKEFTKLLKRLGLHQAGLGFYTLRHVFRTIGDESRDQVAVNSIMGHADESMAAAYRERIGDDRLQAVVKHVRAWLFGNRETR